MTDPVPRAGRRSRSRLTPFQRLARPHALMAAGEAVMAISLANSLFFSIRPGEARGKVLLFLALSMAPFAVIAPLIGPAIDRMPGGRRLVVQIVALGRCLVAAADGALPRQPPAVPAGVRGPRALEDVCRVEVGARADASSRPRRNWSRRTRSSASSPASPASWRRYRPGLLQLVSPKAHAPPRRADLRRRVPHGDRAAARDRGGDAPGLPGAGGAALRRRSCSPPRRWD